MALSRIYLKIKINKLHINTFIRVYLWFILNENLAKILIDSYTLKENIKIEIEIQKIILFYITILNTYLNKRRIFI